MRTSVARSASVSRSASEKAQSPFVIRDTCVKCGACAADCPVQVITEGATQFIIGQGCIGCGDCYEICPVGAIKYIDKVSKE